MKAPSTGFFMTQTKTPVNHYGLVVAGNPIPASVKFLKVIMLKNKHYTEVNRDKYIEAGKKDAEAKHKFRKATRPNKKDKYH